MKPRVTVTGGAGFIGSQLTESLVAQGYKVTILDNFSSGSKGNLASLDSNGIEIVQGDCNQINDVRRATSQCDILFHLAGIPDVRFGTRNPAACYRENVYATYALLEALKATRVRTVVYASTSTVYGDPLTIPTPETYIPLSPISVYGTSKLLAEKLVASHCQESRRRAVILRLANIVGPRSHGVISDLLKKIQDSPSQLEVLGNGYQSKSYLHVDDCTQAILRVMQIEDEPVDVYNVGSEDQIDVRHIVKILLEEVGLDSVDLLFTSETEDGRGWMGDVRSMLLDIAKLKRTGWKPTHNSEQSIRLAIKEHLTEHPFTLRKPMKDLVAIAQ